MEDGLVQRLDRDRLAGSTQHASSFQGSPLRCLPVTSYKCADSSQLFSRTPQSVQKATIR
ncbi:hypothetical protein K523DRAFT_113422 [Schizophyllum commune Tattone D]|nr:hypothetical protein K523DRAFT_113422 [Schizophyllum commune Tattone D]